MHAGFGRCAFAICSGRVQLRSALTDGLTCGSKRRVEAPASTGWTCHSDTLKGLLDRYQGLGDRANQLKPTIQTVAETVRQGGSGETRAPVEAAHLEGVLAQMADIVSAAETLKRAATDADFSDVAEEVDSVRQQVLAAKNRFALFATRVVPSESEDVSPPAMEKLPAATARTAVPGALKPREVR